MKWFDSAECAAQILSDPWYFGVLKLVAGVVPANPTEDSALGAVLFHARHSGRSGICISFQTPIQGNGKQTALEYFVNGFGSKVVEFEIPSSSIYTGLCVFLGSTFICVPKMGL